MAKGKARRARKAIPNQATAGAVDRGKALPPAPTSQGDNVQLSWRVAMLDEGGPWGWAKADPQKLGELREKLSNFETMAWNEVFRSGSKNKRIPVEHLCPDAQRRLEKRRLDDVEELYELRIAGKPRIWGIRQDAVYYLLWWDPEHTVCPSQLRHT